MTFEFATAGRILFGRGRSRQIPALARDLGARALVVLGGSGRGREALSEGLNSAGLLCRLALPEHNRGGGSGRLRARW